MKNSIPQQIGAAAENIVRVKLPRSWVANDHRYDFGKDLHVETATDDGTMSGESFYIQVKGKQNARINKRAGAVSFPLDSKDAAYYMDRVSEPVIFVGVDITTEEAWYFFLQPFLRSNQEWRKKKTLQIPIPLANRLEKSSDFAAAVMEAKQKMRVQRADSIPNAIAAHKQHLEEVDPRFIANVSVVEGHTHVKFEARELVNMRLRFGNAGEKATERIDDLIRKGKEVSFEPGEVQIDGMPLLQDFERTGGRIHFRNDKPLSLRLLALKDGIEIGRLEGIRGVINGGLDEYRFTGDIDKGVFQVRMTFSNNGRIQVQIDPSLGSWDKATIRTAPYFDAIAPFFDRADEATSLALEGIYEGNVLFRNEVAANVFDPDFCFFVRLLTKARYICQQFNIDAPMPLEDLLASAVNEIEVLYLLLTKGKCVLRMPNLAIWIEEKMPCPYVVGDKHYDITMRGIAEFTFFGVVISAELERVFTNMQIVKVHELPTSDYKVDLVGNEKTLVITTPIKLMKDSQIRKIEGVHP